MLSIQCHNVMTFNILNSILTFVGFQGQGGSNEVGKYREELFGVRERRMNFGLVERAFGSRDRGREEIDRRAGRPHV